MFEMVLEASASFFLNLYLYRRHTCSSSVTLVLHSQTVTVSHACTEHLHHSSFRAGFIKFSDLRFKSSRLDPTSADCRLSAVVLSFWSVKTFQFILVDSFIDPWNIKLPITCLKLICFVQTTVHNPKRFNFVFPKSSNKQSFDQFFSSDKWLELIVVDRGVTVTSLVQVQLGTMFYEISQLCLHLSALHCLTKRNTIN